MCHLIVMSFVIQESNEYKKNMWWLADRRILLEKIIAPSKIILLKQFVWTESGVLKSQHSVLDNGIAKVFDSQLWTWHYA